MGSNGDFPAGLRVLVVDHDSTSNLEKLLKKFKYEVRTCNSARVALDMLGEKNEKFNFEIVISDVNMQDMDGFEFLQYVAHKLEVLVIMMSGDGETGRVMRGIRSGACAYLPKPIQSRDAQFIWQHVYRKRMGDVNSPSPMSEIVLMAEKNKRESVEGSDRGGGEVEVNSKKPRVIWTPELHQKFENAVDQITRNKEKVGPKRILELMGDTSLTREQIASHLQKHRSKGEREEAASASASASASDTETHPQQQMMHQNIMIDGHQDIATDAPNPNPTYMVGGYHPHIGFHHLQITNTDFILPPNVAFQPHNNYNLGPFDPQFPH